MAPAARPRRSSSGRGPACSCSPGERPVRPTKGFGRVERVDGGESRDTSFVEGIAASGGGAGLHAHAGDEHHLVLRGRWRMTQGQHVAELGPGDYIRWDGTIPHNAEVIGDEEGHSLIVTLVTRDRPTG